MRNFIKTLLLVLIVMMGSMSVNAENVVETISVSNMGLSSSTTKSQTFAGVAGTCATTCKARYSGKVATNANLEYFKIASSNGNYFACSTTSGGTLKKIRVYFAAGNTADQSKLKLYAGSSVMNTATPSEDNYVSTLNYTNGDTYVDYVFSQTVTYFTLKAEFTTFVDYVEVTWDIPTFYSISKNLNGFDCSLSVASEAASGAKVTVTLTCDNEYYDVNANSLQLIKQVGGTVYLTTTNNASPYTYSFTMPSCPVTLSVNLIDAPERDDNFVSTNNPSYTIASGTTISFTVSTMGDYDGTLIYKSSKEDVATVDGNRKTFTAYAQGTTTITITAPQTDNYYEASTSFNVTVVPREISLFSEYNGEHYAATTSLSGGKLTAQQVSVAGDNVVYTTVSPSASLVWYVCISGSGYTLQNSSKQYLAQVDEVLTFQSSPYVWLKPADIFKKEKAMIIYSNAVKGFRAENELLAGTTGYSTGAQEGGFVKMNDYTIRSVKADRWSAICLPYAVPEGCYRGAEFYDVVGKVMDGESLKNLIVEKHTGALTRGQSYVIYSASAGSVKVYSSESTASASPIETTGLVGNLNSSPLYVPVGGYGFINNKICRVASPNYASVSQNCAYITLINVPDYAGAGSAPGRVSLAAEDENATTDLENLEQANTLDWNQPVYNVMGQLVGAGATGLLIQNGQKFFVK